MPHVSVFFTFRLLAASASGTSGVERSAQRHLQLKPLRSLQTKIHVWLQPTLGHTADLIARTNPAIHQVQKLYPYQRV